MGSRDNNYEFIQKHSLSSDNWLTINQRLEVREHQGTDEEGVVRSENKTLVEALKSANKILQEEIVEYGLQSIELPDERELNPPSL